MEERIFWNIGKPVKEKEYLVTLKNGSVTQLTYYPSDDIWMDDLDGEESEVVSWADNPIGYNPIN